MSAFFKALPTAWVRSFTAGSGPATGAVLRRAWRGYTATPTVSQEKKQKIAKNTNSWAGGGIVAAAYGQRIAAGEIEDDPAQHAAIQALDAVAIAALKRDAAQNMSEEDQLGLYLHGGVGVGKSLLMDMLFEHAPVEAKRRTHFHAFMLEVHQRLHIHRQNCAWGKGGEAVDAVGKELAAEAKLLCFDEFQVTDIADAMILRRLFEVLFQQGVVMVATSNRHPTKLYEGGLNRYHFLPFIKLLQEKSTVLELTGQEDYRRRSDAMPGIYNTPLNEKSAAALEHAFAEASGGSESAEEIVCVGGGRVFRIPRASGAACWFTFDELCNTPTGAADFAVIAQKYEMVVLAGIPKLSSEYHNQARRLITLIDACYEHGVRLVCSAATPIDHLFTELNLQIVGNEDDFGDNAPIPSSSSSAAAHPAATASNAAATSAMPLATASNVGGDGNQQDYWPGSDGLSHTVATMRVIGEGGASGRSTTTIDGVEFSATGRVGVSLAELAAVKEVGFAFSRATSRLHEMCSEEFGRHAKTAW